MLRTWNVGRLARALPGVRAMALRDGLRRGLRQTSIDSAGRPWLSLAIAALKYCEQVAGVRFRQLPEFGRDFRRPLAATCWGRRLTRSSGPPPSSSFTQRHDQGRRPSRSDCSPLWDDDRGFQGWRRHTDDAAAGRLESRNAKVRNQVG